MRAQVGPARLAGLACVALIVAGLVYLDSASAPEPVEVWPGAQPGELRSEPCEYGGERGTYPADCGVLVVSEDPGSAASPLIALPVVRIRSVSHNPMEPVFYLRGGPGQSNLVFPVADRYAGHRDVVLVGYRGIDGSVRLDCPEVESELKRSTDILSPQLFAALEEAFRACADRLTDDGFDLARYGLVQQVEDLETARVALGYDRINLLSQSAGTRTAMIYGLRHPESIHRSVMIGAAPPDAFVRDPETTAIQIDRFAALCARDRSCRARTADLGVTLRRTARDIPDRWLFLPIKDSNDLAASLSGLSETAPTELASASTTIDVWLSASEEDPSGLWLASLLMDLLLTDTSVQGQYASAMMLDAHAGRAYFTDGPGDLSNPARAATAFGWAGGRLVEAWPPARDEGDYRRLGTSDVHTLVVNGELDVSTPPQLASAELLPQLPNGEEVILPGFGHTASFFLQQPQAGTELVNTFLDTGRVDESGYQPQSLDFTPAMSFGSVAKAVLGTMLALATLTVISLLAVARRVHTRRRLGGASRLALRSVYAVVLGLGGWCLGALIVLTTMPGVRIDNPVLVVLSVGLPMALAAFAAWVDAEQGPVSRGAGFATGIGGAVAGAWLGYGVLTGPLVLVTAIAGALAGVNLALIALDMSSRQYSLAHRPPTAVPPTPTVEMPTSPVADGPEWVRGSR